MYSPCSSLVIFNAVLESILTEYIVIIGVFRSASSHIYVACWLQTINESERSFQTFLCFDGYFRRRNYSSVIKVRGCLFPGHSYLCLTGMVYMVNNASMRLSAVIARSNSDHPCMDIILIHLNMINLLYLVLHYTTCSTTRTGLYDNSELNTEHTYHSQVPINESISSLTSRIYLLVINHLDLILYCLLLYN